MKTRTQQTHSQANAFWFLGVLTLVRDDMRAELTAYRARVRAAAAARVKIAWACQQLGLPASAAMKLLNATIEQERTV